MGLEMAGVPGRFQNQPESVTLTSMDTLRMYDDAHGFLTNGELERKIAPGDVFELFIPFRQDHPMLAGKSHEEQKALMQKISHGDFSIRSKIAISGVVHTEKEATVTLQDDGTWVMQMEFANDGPEELVVPTGVKIGKPFERTQNSLTGEELLQAAVNLSDTNHVQFITRLGAVVDREAITAEAMRDATNPLYPVAVVLPYAPEVGNLKPGAPIHLNYVPSRADGFEEKYVNWQGSIPQNENGGHSVILKRTRGVISIPEGYAGVIKLQGLQGEIPHGLSTVLDSDPRHRAWQIIAEHGTRHAGENRKNPTAFVMQLYKAA